MHVILKKMENIHNKKYIIYFNFIIVFYKNTNFHKSPQFNYYFTNRLFEKKRE